MKRSDATSTLMLATLAILVCALSLWWDCRGRYDAQAEAFKRAGISPCKEKP